MYLGEKGKRHILIKINFKRREMNLRNLITSLKASVESGKGANDHANREPQAEDDHFEQMEEAYLVDREKLCTLFDKGIIDESGMPIQNREESDMR